MLPELYEWNAEMSGRTGMPCLRIEGIGSTEIRGRKMAPYVKSNLLLAAALFDW